MNSRFLIAAALAAVPSLALAQTTQQLKNQPPDGAQLTFQLTDGTVLAQGYRDSDFWVLTPDNTGSYVNGTWKQVGSLQSGYSPSANASQVLADGRVLFEGGEYNFGSFALTNLGAVYDPVKQTWTPVKPPKGWKNIGDSPSVVLPDARFLLGDKLNKKDAELDPKTMKWTEVSDKGKNDFNAEEGWTLMPDGSVLTYDVKDHPQSEYYVPTKGKWLNLGSTVVNLQAPDCSGNCCLNYPPHNKCYYPPGEVGPAVLMPNGTVFATGASDNDQAAHTAVYTPGSGWAAGPDFPDGDAAGDSFITLLTNGDAMVEGNSGRLYIFDGTTLTSTSTNGDGMLMILPTGQILINGSEVYNSSGTYQAAWQPTISTYPSSVTPGDTYQISGTQFNGLSQTGGGMGDEYQSSTNYPLVQITNNSTKHVFYAREHDPSTMGVATGSTTVSTSFDVPTTVETGASSLVVIANGIPSTPVSITVQ
ncbi:MAG TPA: hypothetical protein VHX61_06380 [Rhizomicrobium sp.]|jgi:hypothetical protein|nr:hypothetical protein [Rhizomicrobium sp.]